MESFGKRRIVAKAVRNQVEKPEVQRLLRMKLQTMNTGREQIKKLREEIHAQREIQKEYAHEYYLMGNECITKAHDPNAAIRSFDTSQSLDPGDGRCIESCLPRIETIGCRRHAGFP